MINLRDWVVGTLGPILAGLSVLVPSLGVASPTISYDKNTRKFRKDKGTMTIFQALLASTSAAH